MSDKSRKIGIRYLETAILFVFGLCLALLVSEFLLRWFYPQEMRLNISRWDPYVGFTLTPNMEGYAKHSDYTMHVRINSRGLRDREFDFSKPEGIVRIGAFGDSFTFGEGVQNDETYPKVLEELLNRADYNKDRISGFQVLNFGIGGTGTSHQLAWYQKEGRRYDLDIVLLGFMGGNDFGDNWNGVFDLENGRLVHNPNSYTVIRKIQSVVYKVPMYQWLATNSHLVNLIRKAATVIHGRLQKGGDTAVEVRNKMTQQETLQKKYELTIRLIEKFRTEATDNGSLFLVINLPTKHQKPLHQYGQEDSIKPYVKLAHSLVDELRKRGFYILDLVPVISRLDRGKYYFPNDGHMNKIGHRLIAEKIYTWVVPEMIEGVHEQSANVGKYTERDHFIGWITNGTVP